MLGNLSVRRNFIALTCSIFVAALAHAAGPRQIDVAEGDLITAIESLSRQADVEIVYQSEQLKGMRTQGVKGTLSAQEAVRKLLAGTKLEIRTDATSGAMLIAVPSRASSKPIATNPPTTSVSPNQPVGKSEKPPGFWGRLWLTQAATTSPTAARSFTNAEAADPRNAESARSADAEELGGITVTGTRIQQAIGMETPTPVTALSANELQAMSASSLTEAMTQLPQFFNSQTAENFGAAANGFFQSPGGGSLNLRGIGTNRTLTLLDGRRMPPASIVGGPDINTFPDQLLQRVETVTGGASAAYGTDAVSGVINYILDTKFEGVKARVQFGRTDLGDGPNQKYTFAVGHALGDDAHLLFSAAHSNQTAINYTGDRNWYQSCGLITNPALAANAPNSATSQSKPRLIPACNLRSTQYSMEGVLNPATATAGNSPAAYVPALGPITFDANGNAIPFSKGTLVSQDGTVQSGGSGADLAKALNVLLPGATRSNAFTYLDYNVTDHLNVYVQGMYDKQRLSRSLLVGSYGLSGFFHPITIYRDNAYLPDSLRQAMVTNNIQQLTFDRQLTPLDGALGRQSDNSRESVGTAGFKSTLSGGYFDGWNVDGYFQYGTTDIDWRQENGARGDRVFLAVDAVRDPATGQIKCRVTAVSGLRPDCVPLDLFGSGNASAAAIDWITGFDPGVAVSTTPYIASAQSYASEPYTYIGDEAKHRLTTLNQRVGEITASGNLFEGWAGPVQAAFGANYRRESVNQRVRASQGNPAADPSWYPVWCNDPGAANGAQCTAAILAVQTNSGYRPAGTIGVRGVPGNVQSNIVETQFSNVPNIEGNYDVKELFTETVVPLLRNLRWMKSLNFQGAVRWADYAGSGQIWSWKGGLDAQITDQIRLRGTYSHDTRAGNISDRFDRSGGVGTAIDKKVPGSGGPPVLSTTQTFAIVSGGNPNIKPEVGNTFTAGVVYRPDWLAGFDMSADWLRVQLNDAIESLSPQQIVDQCYLNGDEDQCAHITRDASTGTDRIIFINVQKQNINKALFNGVDFELGYSHGVNLLGGGERISARLIGTYLIEASTTNFSGVKTDNTGSLPLQYFTKKINLSLNYTRGGFGWNLNGIYNNGGTTNLNWNRPDASGTINWNSADNHTGASVYWNTRLSYRRPVGSGGELEFFGNVTNLFDRDPPLVLTQGIGTQTAGGYDQIGRRYATGINLRF
jgi:outer membrane receptor protein involved in Fe transport